MSDKTDYSKMTEEDWKKKLSPEEFKVLRKQGTQRPFEGKHLDNFKEGTYHCKGCGQQLYDSSSKFKAHCGWPAFFGKLFLKLILKLS